MPRIARAVFPGLPHHVTQRGNRRMPTFFSERDYETYLGLMAEWCTKFDVEIWAYCLMPNHVHLIAVPPSAEALRVAVGEAHRRYTVRMNGLQKWTGHLWQGRFASYVMDERYLLAAARYVEMNPVRANLVERPGDYPWSSARAHLTGRNDSIVTVRPLLERTEGWGSFLECGVDNDTRSAFRGHEATGHPLGDESFVRAMEDRAGRIMRPGKAGRPKNGDSPRQPRRSPAFRA